MTFSVRSGDSTKLPLNKLTLLSITTSDNTASLWLQSLAGTGTVINQWLASNGFDSTRVNSRTPGSRGTTRQVWLGADDSAGNGQPAGQDPKWKGGQYLGE